MGKYDSWKSKILNINSIILDSKNPRIPAGSLMDQKSLIEELVCHDGVESVASSIVHEEYFPTEAIIVTKEEGKYVVLEGNRRLAALKVLSSPECAPASHRKVFQKLQSRMSEPIKTIRVWVCPKRDDARPIIVSRHTSANMIQRWSPTMQGGFYQRLLDEGETINSIAKQHDLETSEIRDRLYNFQVHTLASKMDLSDTAKSAVADLRKFQITTLSRITASTPGQDFMGITKQLDGLVSPEEFAKSFTKVIEDVVSKKIDSRKLNSKQEIDQYLKSIKNYKASRRKKGSFKYQDFTSAKKTPTKNPASPTRKRKPSSRLFPQSLKCESTNDRITDMFDEISKFKFDKHLQTISVMLRVFLDLCVSDYLDRYHPQVITQLRSQKGKKGGKVGHDWYPTLRQMLSQILGQNLAGLEPLEIKSLNKFNDKGNKNLSLDSLDGMIHNRLSFPSENELKAILIAIEPLLRKCLQSPPEETE